MKLNSIFKLDIICLLFSTTTSIPLNENIIDVNSNKINDNNLFENSLYLNNNNDIDNNEVSSSIWIDKDSINEITNSHLTISYIPITETFEIKPTTATSIEPITKSSTLPTITSVNETNYSEETISDNTQNENEFIPIKISETIVLDEILPTNSITSTNIINETQTEIGEEIEVENETEISEIESDEMEVEIETIDSETELMETEIETESTTSYIPIPEVASHFSNKFLYIKYKPSDDDEVQTDTIDMNIDEDEVNSLSPAGNNPNDEYSVEEEEEDADDDDDKHKHTVSSKQFPYTNKNTKKYGNKNRFNHDHSSDYSKDYFKNKKQNKNYKNSGKKGQFSNNKDFYTPKFKHNPFSRIKHKQSKKENKISKTKTSTTIEDNNTPLRTKTTTTIESTTKPSQTVKSPKNSSPVPSKPSATPAVSVLHDNVVNAVCWTLPNEPCCNSCDIYKPHNYTSSIVKYYGKENGDLCGISDLCIVDEHDNTHNDKNVIDSEGNEIQKSIILNSNQNIKKVKKSNEETIIKIPICWSNSIPCCEECTVVTSSNTNENQYLGW